MALFQVLSTVIILTTFLHVEAQDFVSPCPRFFVYERKGREPDRWYGIITLLSDTDLTGVWLRVMFDRPSLLLGNWFGQAQPRNENKEYLIKNRDFELKAGTPQTVRFFVKYDTSQPMPRLVGFRLNAKTVCPEGGGTALATPEVGLHTSAELDTTSKPAPAVGININTDSIIRPGGIDLGSAFNSPIDFLTPVNKPNADTDAVCGTVVLQPSELVRPLITYGEVTSEGEFPWHVAMYQTKGVNLDYFCGGSLVSRYHVVTAAHCVTKPRTQSPRDVDSMVIYMGRYYLHRFTKGIQERLVAEITPHPEYNAQKLSYDIAVVKFTSPVEITDYVRPICLWQESSDLQSIINKLGNVVGWGFDENGKLTQQLMQAKMPVVSQEICLRSVPTFYPLFTSDKTYCAGFANGTSVCNGDSGGGMVFPRSSSDPTNVVWQLRGIVSLSVDLERKFKCDPNHYIIFTDAAKYVDWIKRTLQQ